MYKSVDLHTFRNAFQAIRPDSFSYKGLEVLFDYLEDLEDQTGEKIELDVIAICCDFSEYESLEEFQGEYNDITLNNQSMDELSEHTIVIEIPGTPRFIIQQF